MSTRKVLSGSTSSLSFVDHRETYGRHILAKIVKEMPIGKCIDLGCGFGEDLLVVKKFNPDSELIGVDFGLWNCESLFASGIKPVAVNIENEPLPAENESMDLVIANQILEHTKEIFWINHEIFRCLKIGGVLYLGVPNLLSLHNRVLMLLGSHPTCNKLTSAHVRVFSRKGVESFYRDIGKKFCCLENFYGSQFYPFPAVMSRVLAGLFPTFAVASFFVVRKTGPYEREFLEWPALAKLQTNYYVG